jgi:hypothetical protein
MLDRTPTDALAVLAMHLVSRLVQSSAIEKVESFSPVGLTPEFPPSLSFAMFNRHFRGRLIQYWPGRTVDNGLWRFIHFPQVDYTVAEID